MRLRGGASSRAYSGIQQASNDILLVGFDLDLVVQVLVLVQLAPVITSCIMGPRSSPLHSTPQHTAHRRKV
jgi:hypothetical protein